MDDIWADDETVSDTTYDRQMSERGWNRLHDTHGVSGYKDGISEAKESSLQKGFDIGYGDAAQIGFYMGRLRGIVSTMIQIMPHTYNGPDKSSIQAELHALHTQLEQVGVENVFIIDYFKDHSALPSAKAEQSQCDSRQGTVDSNPAQRFAVDCRERVTALFKKLGWNAELVSI
ncbi:hypothetical protein DFS34DRAFT_645307 [Phlyctochytrium arcticum]|nr:hypothetical protein DFS34DRAFT_645307 [Phlyctochytrium arcticum]